MRRLAFLGLLVGLAAGVGAEEETKVEAPDPRSVLGAPRGRALSGPALDAESDRIAGLLRCPVCQGLSVADSPTGMAVHMRQQAREMVEAGYDKEQVLSYFEKSYGEFVRLEPPLRGVNWLVWAGPPGGLLLGALVVRGVLRSRPSRTGSAKETSNDSGEPPPGPDSLPSDALLAPYVLLVRERAYGWPGGISPTSSGLAIPAPSRPHEPVS
jgi:cytochrome c-type biogenesis protein CcmH